MKWTISIVFYREVKSKLDDDDDISKRNFLYDSIVITVVIIVTNRIKVMIIEVANIKVLSWITTTITAIIVIIIITAARTTKAVVKISKPKVAGCLLPS